MNADQYRKACAQLAITVRRSAEVLSVSERQAYRYANGRSPVPEMVAKLLRALIRLGTIDV
jgi:hypothetical protein